MAYIAPIKHTLKDGRHIQLRTIQGSDAESYLAFRRQIPHDSTHTMQYVGIALPSVEEAVGQLDDRAADPLNLCLGAFEGDRVMALLHCRIPRADHPWAKHIAEFGMMVLKEYWGFGIGRKLLQVQEEFLRPLGITRIEAMVRTANPRGIMLYVGGGFQIEGHRRWAAKIDGQYQDEYYIAKLLK